MVRALAAPRHRRRVALLGLLALLSGCSGDHNITGPNGVSLEGLILSHPVPPPAAAAQLVAAFRGALAGEHGADSVVYASLVPGTAPTGVTATVRALTSGASVTTAVQGGGFDPVPVTARVGDTVAIAVGDASGAIVFGVEAAVTPIRRIKVVRTDPAPGKRDQPLNANIVIVFSDPVDASTLTASSVQLFRGTAPVAGTVGLLSGSATAVVFSPSQLLDPNTDYRLVVTQAVRDETGDALAENATVDFTTGTTTVGLAYVVSVVPDTTALSTGSQVQLIAVVHDSSGASIAGRPVAWSSGNPAVATVSTTGLVTALAQGEANVQAEVDGRTGVAVIRASGALAPVASVSVSPESAMVVSGGFVQLTAVLRDAAGNIVQFRPVNWETGTPGVAAVSGGSGGMALVTGISSGTATITATSEGKSGTARITVGTIGPFTQISTGGCALTTDGAAWCWGSNGAGELGNGTVISSTVPTAVAGGLRFSRISGTCALTVDSAAYCWGLNWYGALGIGTAAGPEQCPNVGPCSTTPMAVVGGLRFSAIDRGVLLPFTCALAESGDAYCWGNNELYQLGLGTRTGPEDCPGSCSTAPAKVTGGFTFIAVSAGRGHACALTASGAAYCWGANYAGQLGDGTTSDRISPVPVAGGHAFASIAAGYEHTCAVASDGSAYCWGSGPLGGSTSSSWNPVPVADTLRFATITAGVHHTCALTRAGAAYCWGGNYAGQLGNGTFDGSATPVAVAGGHVFASVDVGDETSCGVTTTGVAYCWGSYASNVPVKVPGQP